MQTKLRYYAGRIVAFYQGNWQNYGVRGVGRVTSALSLTLFAPLVVRLGPAKCHCPCCGWRGSRFLPFLATGYIVFNTLCPVCASAPRHRAHRLFYENSLRFGERSGELLYFAPERNLKFFQDNPNLVVKTSNYPDGEADFHVDILEMPFEDNTWDYIVCHRVVEHLSDDRLGMENFLRVLRPGGMAIISVPIESSREATIEYGKPNPLENEHYYDYGMDFMGRIPAGFEVERVRFSEAFSEQVHQELALIEDFIFICRKPSVTSMAA